MTQRHRTKTIPAGQLKATAYHEAGHAVISRILTLVSGRASIVPDYKAGTWGSAQTGAPEDAEARWAELGRVRGDGAALRARIITWMAGAETEIELLNRLSVGDSDDRRNILEWAEGPEGFVWARHEPRMRALTRMLVRRHRDSIKRVAEALLEKGGLSAPEVDRLVGRCIDDVRPRPCDRTALH